MTTKSLKKKSVRANRSTVAKAGHTSGGVSNARSSHKPSSREGAAKRLQSRIVTKRGVAPKPQMPVDEKHVAAVRNFELGLHHEQRQNYRKAREVFEKLVAAAPADVADRARVHLRACIERLGANGLVPKTAGDYHVLGVAELNVRELDRAVEHLSKAQKLDPQREEIRYALAAAHALKGNREEALEHLEVAITLRPQNRFQARHDADFQPLAGDPRFLSLISQNGFSAHGTP
jgi:tetratricopeptide (TPR) repeat protein